MNSQSVAISMVYPIMKALVDKGYNTEQFCSYASFDASLLQNVEARIPAEELERLMVAAASYTQDAFFGLHQGQITEFADLGILGYVMMHSKQIADALAAFQRYNVVLCSGFNLDWEIQADDVIIQLYLQYEGQLSRHCVEDMASSLYRLTERLSNRQIALKEIEFAHDAPGDMQPYLEVFGRVPQFGRSGNRLRMSKDVLQSPVLYSDARLLEVFQKMADESRAELTHTGLFSEQVRQWMKKNTASFFPTLQQTADFFGISTRTLQNKLKQEKTSFNDLSTQVRKELALHYLKKRELSVGEIAYVLHFSEPSAFQSSFKKWMGVTPGQYRATIRQTETRAQ